jgi:hypothetical protein
MRVACFEQGTTTRVYPSSVMGTLYTSDRAKRYREAARRCAELAMQVRDKDTREAFKFIEQQWLDLADQAERYDIR